MARESHARRPPPGQRPWRLGIVAGGFFTCLLLGLAINVLLAIGLITHYERAGARVAAITRMADLSQFVALHSVRLTDERPSRESLLGQGVERFSHSLAALDGGGVVEGIEIQPLSDPGLRAYLPKIRRDWDALRSRVQGLILDSYASPPGAEAPGRDGVPSALLRQWVIDDADVLLQTLRAFGQAAQRSLAAQYQRNLAIAIAVLACDLILMLLAFVLVRRHLVVPIQKLRSVWAELMRGNYGTRVDYRGYSELSELAAAFNDGAQRIQDLLETVRRDRSGLERADMIFRGLAVNSMVGIFLAEGERFSFVSEKMAEIFGYEPQEMVERVPVMGIIAPRERYLVAEAVKASLNRKDATVHFERRGRRKDGALIDVEVFSSTLRVGESTAVVGIVQDITERKRTEASAMLAEIAYENSSEAMAITDAAGVIVSVNPAYARVTGQWADEVVGETLHLLRPGRHNRDFFDAMWHAINTTGRWEGEYWTRRPTGEEYAERVVVDTAWNHDGSVNCRVAMIRDVTERKQADAQVWWQAHHDPLTSLPNRQYFNERIAEAVRQVDRGGLPLALMFLDLDGFKAINDSRGHAVGDRVLTEVGARLRSSVGEAGFAARLGGDEFVVLLEELPDDQAIEHMRDALMSAVLAPFLIMGEALQVSVSIGIARYPQDADDTEALLRHVDQAMYAAKSDGLNRARYFDDDMQARARMLRELIDGLPRALGQDEFFMLYQPIYGMDAGQLLKAEALLRWKHPRLGVLRPMEFLPMADDHRLLGRIGDWVLERVARDAHRWRASGDVAVQVIVNVSVAQLEAEPDCASKWLARLAELDARPEWFVIELSERALANLGAQGQANLAALRHAGVGLGVTGFGPDASSMSAMGRRSADYFKLDGASVSQILEDDKAWKICEAIIQLAHKLGVPVLAQGVATEAQHDSLQRAGCDAVQGYWYDEPLDSGTFAQRLIQGHWARHEA